MSKPSPVILDLKWKLEVQTALLRQAKISTYLVDAVTALKDGDKVEDDITEALDKHLEEYLSSVQEVMDLLETRIEGLENE